MLLHEIGHLIGLYHEQTRLDRDTYIEVIWSEIVQGQEHNFEKRTVGEVDSRSVPYDYKSIMHYGKSVRVRGEIYGTFSCSFFC